MTDQPTHYWKIHVTFPNPEEMGFAGESMHGERLGDGPEENTGLYKVGNIPFFAALRLHDVIVCDESDPDPRVCLCPRAVRTTDRARHLRGWHDR